MWLLWSDSTTSTSTPNRSYQETVYLSLKAPHHLGCGSRAANVVSPTSFPPSSSLIERSGTLLPVGFIKWYQISGCSVRDLHLPYFIYLQSTFAKHIFRAENHLKHFEPLLYYLVFDLLNSRLLHLCRVAGPKFLAARVSSSRHLV